MFGTVLRAVIWLRHDTTEITGALYEDARHGGLLRAAAVSGGIPVRSYEVAAAPDDPAVIATLARLARQRYTPAPLRQRRSVAWQARWGREIDHLALANTAREYLLVRGMIEGGAWLPTGQEIANVLDPAGAVAPTP